MASNLDRRARLVVTLALLVVVAYGVECVLYYGAYLNMNLRFVAPARPFAIADVLGFGFWVTWLVFFALFTLAAGCWWRFKATPPRYLVMVVIVFFTLTALDFALYRVLEKQVLAM